MKIKIFKISEVKMYTFRNKNEFNEFVKNIVGYIPYENPTIKELMALLPKNDYCKPEK